MDPPGLTGRAGESGNNPSSALSNRDIPGYPVTWDIPLQLWTSPDLTNLKGDCFVCLSPIEIEAVVLQTCFEAEFLMVAFETLVTHDFPHNLLNVAHLHGKVSIDRYGGNQYRFWWCQSPTASKGRSYLSVRPLPTCYTWDIKDSIKHIPGYPDLLP